MSMGFFFIGEECVVATLTVGEIGSIDGLVLDNDQTSVLIEFPSTRNPILPIAEEVGLTLSASNP